MLWRTAAILHPKNVQVSFSKLIIMVTEPFSFPHPYTMFYPRSSDQCTLKTHLIFYIILLWMNIVGKNFWLFFSLVFSLDIIHGDSKTQSLPIPGYPVCAEPHQGHCAWPSPTIIHWGIQPIASVTRSGDFSYIVDAYRFFEMLTLTGFDSKDSIHTSLLHP